MRDHDPEEHVAVQGEQHADDRQRPRSSGERATSHALSSPWPWREDKPPCRRVRDGARQLRRSRRSGPRAATTVAELPDDPRAVELLALRGDRRPVRPDDRAADGDPGRAAELHPALVAVPGRRVPRALVRVDAERDAHPVGGRVPVLRHLLRVRRRARRGGGDERGRTRRAGREQAADRRSGMVSWPVRGGRDRGKLRGRRRRRVAPRPGSGRRGAAERGRVSLPRRVLPPGSAPLIALVAVPGCVMIGGSAPSEGREASRPSSLERRRPRRAGRSLRGDACNTEIPHDLGGACT